MTKPIDFELFRRFLLEFMPDEYKAAVNRVLDGVKESPVQALNGGFHYHYSNYFYSPNKEVAAASCNGIILGFAMAYAAQFPEVEADIRQCVVDRCKISGDNVVDFFEKRGKLNGKRK